MAGCRRAFVLHLQGCVFGFVNAKSKPCGFILVYLGVLPGGKVGKGGCSPTLGSGLGIRKAGLCA